MPGPDAVDELRARVSALEAQVADAEAELDATREELSLLERFAVAARSTDFRKRGALGVMARAGGLAYFAMHAGDAFHDGSTILATGLTALMVIVIGVEWWNIGLQDEERVEKLETAFLEAAQAPLARVELDEEGAEPLEADRPERAHAEREAR